MSDRLLRLNDVKKITGLSRASIYRKMSRGDFPKAVKPSTNVTAWRKSDIDGWIKALPEYQ